MIKSDHQKEVLKILETGRLRYRTPLSETMSSREIRTGDVLNVLRGGEWMAPTIINGHLEFAVRTNRMALRVRIVNDVTGRVLEVVQPKPAAAAGAVDSRHDYVECGLDDVVLHGVVVETHGDGSSTVTIPAVIGLHELLVDGLLRKPDVLNGKEVRFLRVHKGWSAIDTGRFLRKAPETVARWEAGSRPVDPTADLLLRLLVKQEPSIDNYLAWDLNHVEEPKTQAARHLSFAGKWTTRSAALP
jgi:DNA-binding transcriptional regulator YiaG